MLNDIDCIVIFYELCRYAIDNQLWSSQSSNYDIHLHILKNTTNSHTYQCNSLYNEITLQDVIVIYNRIQHKFRKYKQLELAKYKLRYQLLNKLQVLFPSIKIRDHKDFNLLMNILSRHVNKDVNITINWEEIWNRYTTTIQNETKFWDFLTKHSIDISQSKISLLSNKIEDNMLKKIDKSLSSIYQIDSLIDDCFHHQVLDKHKVTNIIKTIEDELKRLYPNLYYQHKKTSSFELKQHYQYQYHAILLNDHDTFEDLNFALEELRKKNKDILDRIAIASRNICPYDFDFSASKNKSFL